jgi:pantoate--beta-alanine ligase
MGALHQGHLSLVERSLDENEVTVVSIFVNPTQFNDPKDLEQYPRNLDMDLAMVRKYPVDMVFTPPVEEIYPERDTRTFDLSPLDEVMEGRFRPGHFNGVAQVVSRLFSIVQPHRAYFGRKDFQQYVIIKHLVDLLKMDVEIIGCPIIREPDGLAMSSRNQLLSRDARREAPQVYRALQRAKELKPSHAPDEIRRLITAELNARELIDVEYFEIVDDQYLKPVVDWDEPVNKVACVAVQLCGVRLIDNSYFD